MCGIGSIHFSDFGSLDTISHRSTVSSTESLDSACRYDDALDELYAFCGRGRLGSFPRTITSETSDASLSRFNIHKQIRDLPEDLGRVTRQMHDDVSDVADSLIKVSDMSFKEINVLPQDYRQSLRDAYSAFNNVASSLCRRFGVSLNPSIFRFGVGRATRAEQVEFYARKGYELSGLVSSEYVDNFNECSKLIVQYDRDMHDKVCLQYHLPIDTPIRRGAKIKALPDGNIMLKENHRAYAPYIFAQRLEDRGLF